MLSKVLDMSKRTVTDIFLWSMLLSNSSVKQIRSNEIFCFHFAFDVWYCLSRLTSCEWAALSHTLERIDISEIGLVFADSSLSPDLRNGTISTYFLGSGKLLKEKELVIRLVMMGAIRGELSFRILAFTSSQPGAFLDGKLARGDGLKHKQGSNVLTGTANRFTRINSLCASNVEIVFLGKIRGFQSCHFSHIN